MHFYLLSQLFFCSFNLGFRMTEYHPSKNFKKVRLRVGEELEWDLYYTAVAYDIYTRVWYNAEESAEESDDENIQGPTIGQNS